MSSYFIPFVIVMYHIWATAAGLYIYNLYAMAAYSYSFNEFPFQLQHGTACLQDREGGYADNYN